MRELSREFSVRQREMRSREQGLLRLLDPLCVQWKPLDQHLPLLRLAGSQGLVLKCAHQSPRALEELPSPTPSNVPPHSAPACLVLVDCGQHGECCWGLSGAGTEAASPWTGREPRSASPRLLRLLRALFELHS